MCPGRSLPATAPCAKLTPRCARRVGSRSPTVTCWCTASSTWRTPSISARRGGGRLRRSRGCSSRACSPPPRSSSRARRCSSPSARATCRSGAGRASAEASAHVFDYGVRLDPLPAAHRRRARRSPTWSRSPRSCSWSPARRSTREARREAEALCERSAPALERPALVGGARELPGLPGPALREGGSVRAQDLLSGADASPSCSSARPARCRSLPPSGRTCSPHHSATSRTTWRWSTGTAPSSREPSGVEDIPDLLEFATAHLLELRYYDALLDRRAAPHLRRDRGGREPRSRTSSRRRYRSLQRRTAALLLELSEMIERLENAVKIVGDFYLARLYQAAVRRFRLPGLAGDGAPQAAARRRGERAHRRRRRHEPRRSCSRSPSSSSSSFEIVAALR